MSHATTTDVLVSVKEPPTPMTPNAWDAACVKNVQTLLLEFVGMEIENEWLLASQGCA